MQNDCEITYSIDEYGNKIETKIIGNKEYVTAWYKGGNKMFKQEFKDGKEEGKWFGWYGNGNDWYKEEYKDGKREGIWITWDKRSGKIVYVEEYKDGKLI